MATRRFDVNKEQSVAYYSGSARGNGNDSHCPTGTWSFDGNFRSRTLWRFAHDWSGMTKVTKIELHARLTTGTHTAQGGNSRLRMARLATSFDTGGGAENSWAYGSGVGSTGGGPAYTGSPDDWALDNAGIHAGDWFTLDVTSVYAGFIPSYVTSPTGSPGAGDTNNGVRIYAGAVDADELGSSYAFEMFGASTGSAPYIIVTYTTNTAPGTPTLTGPANGSTIAVGSQPAFSFSGYDVDPGDNLMSFDLQIDDSSGFGSPAYSANSIPGPAVHPTPQTISNWPYPGTPALTAGATYYWRVRTYDIAGAQSPWSAARSFVMGALPTVTGPSPNASLAYIHNLGELATWTLGGSHARPFVGWYYGHPGGLAGTHYRVRLYSDALAQLYDSGQVALPMTIGKPYQFSIPYAIIMGTQYRWGVEVRDNAGNWSAAMTPVTFKVRWGQAIYSRDITLTGGGLTVTPGALTNSGAGAWSAYAYRMAADAVGTGATAWVGSLGSLPDPVAGKTFLQILVRLSTNVAGTNPSLADLTLSYTTTGAQLPDKWQLAGAITGALDSDVRRYGSYALRITTTANTASWIRPYRLTTGDGIPVSEDTDYVFSCWVRTGQPGGVVRVELKTGDSLANLGGALLTPAIGEVIETSDTSGARDGWQRLMGWVHVPLGTKLIQAFITFYPTASGQKFWVDGAKLEEGRVTSLWTPGFLSDAVTLDSAGVQIDGSEGGLFRLRGTSGGDRDTVELGQVGLIHGSGFDLNSNVTPANPPSPYWRVYGTPTTILAKNSGGGIIDLATSYAAAAWTPVVTYATPGTMSFAYTQQSGWYTRIGNLLLWSIAIQGTITNGTGSGLLRVTGLPFAPTGVQGAAACTMRGYTKAGYTQIGAEPNPGNLILFVASGSAQVATYLAVADIPTGGAVLIWAQGHAFVT